MPHHHHHHHHRATRRGQRLPMLRACAAECDLSDREQVGQGPLATRVRLRRHALAPRMARRVVREQADGVLAAVLVERCALVAGELVTSALRRTNGAVEFSVEIDAGAVTLRVRDRQPLSALAAGSDVWAGCRHGRDITTGLVHSWGYARDESGAQLWATVRDRARPGLARTA